MRTLDDLPHQIKIGNQKMNFSFVYSLDGKTFTKRSLFSIFIFVLLASGEAVSHVFASRVWQYTLKLFYLNSQLVTENIQM